ncbi:hypothetical protein AB0D04_19910 [Streptomyces sp. NPDC048483]|uniref:hypothetical protein n=1 Tax=Streptomyces sp. NPDC048483 TaxID=3154927 RepID=UPI0034491C04
MLDGVVVAVGGERVDAAVAEGAAVGGGIAGGAAVGERGAGVGVGFVEVAKAGVGAGRQEACAAFAVGGVGFLCRVGELLGGLGVAGEEAAAFHQILGDQEEVGSLLAFGGVDKGVGVGGLADEGEEGVGFGGQPVEGGVDEGFGEFFGGGGAGVEEGCGCRGETPGPSGRLMRRKVRACWGESSWQPRSKVARMLRSPAWISVKCRRLSVSWWARWAMVQVRRAVSWDAAMRTAKGR